MNLRNQLKEILPELLPANPADAIKGTDLIRLVKFRLRQEYSDATLRYHFSILCRDPGSPIAKVEQGQGYYLRRVRGSAGHSQAMTQARLGMLFESTPDALNLAESRQQKLRAIFARDVEMSGNFPFLFDSSFAPGAPYENVWRCPDAAVVDWEAGGIAGDGESLDTAGFRMKRAFGLAPFRITSVKLKLAVSYDSYREDFFQALCHARWGNGGELIIAAPVPDHQLVEELRELGSEFGLGVATLGIAPEALDELPPGHAIPRLSNREFEAILSRLQRQRLTSPRFRNLEWSRIGHICQDNSEFRSLFGWLEHCIHAGRAISWRDYAAGRPPEDDGSE